MAKTLMALAIFLALSLQAQAAPTCKTGKPCGDTCISADKECHIPAAKQCKTGKPCGNTCISKDKECHQ